jgi:hypothetical protein
LTSRSYGHVTTEDPSIFVELHMGVMDEPKWGSSSAWAQKHSRGRYRRGKEYDCILVEAGRQGLLLTSSGGRRSPGLSELLGIWKRQEEKTGRSSALYDS